MGITTIKISTANKGRVRTQMELNTFQEQITGLFPEVEFMVVSESCELQGGQFRGQIVVKAIGNLPLDAGNEDGESS